MARKDSGLSFWFNKWMDKDTFRSLMYGPLNRGEEEVRLKDVIGFFGWNWEGLSFIFPSSILLSMKATLFLSLIKARIEYPGAYPLVESLIRKMAIV